MPKTLLAKDSLAALGGPDTASLDPRTMLAATRIGLGVHSLVPKVSVTPTLSLDRSSVKLDVHLNGLVVWSTTLSAANPRDRWTGNQGLVKEDLLFHVDLALGQVTLSGDICLYGLGGWSCQHFASELLVVWSPTIGAVGGKIEAHPPAVIDAQSGPSQSIVPSIIRIPVDDVPRVGTPVGNLVKQTFFADVPGFLFNVCFGVGSFPLAGPGSYGDPTSAWFNVFVGYYQIDCPKPAWTRPFGYTAPGSDPAVDFAEVLRIGKADWNYFSNWMYGVPIATVKQYDAPDPGVQCTNLGRRAVGTSQWDLIDLDGFSAVTAYQSNAPGAAKLIDNTILTPVWRLTYGEPHPRPGYATSFIGADMHARLYMAYFEDASAYHTVLFGGTINKAFDGPHNEQLLAEQMTACETVMTAYYPALGFA